jgi:hypothetical protein
MRKGENIISLALAAAVVLTILALQRKWQNANLQAVASSAEEFILSGIHGQIPDIAGFERVKTFRLDRKYRAGLYRQSPAPFLFAPGRVVLYSEDNQPVFKLETLEGSKESWTTFYDFAGRNGLTLQGSSKRPIYARPMTGTTDPDVIIGQYTGGDHCCTSITILELGKKSVRSLGRIEGLDGLPFEGVEIERIGKDPALEIIAHRPQRTLCGSHEDAADIISVYGYADGQYRDRTPAHVEYLRQVVKRNLAKWESEKTHTLQLLQTLATQYAILGEREQGRRFFALGLTQFLPELKRKGIDPNTCIEDVEGLLATLPAIPR